MPKEELHHWSRTILTILSVAFVCGITYRSIGHNTEDIGTVEKQANENEENIHKLELNQRDIQATYASIAKSLHRIETEQASQGESQQQTVITVTKIQGQVDNLTRDE